MKCRQLRVACVSDIHLGHKRNTTDYIVENLKAAFPDNLETAELDILFIAGDLFDGLLINNSDDVYQADDFIFYLLRLCKKHDILLRVLEGTPSHDFFQSKRIVHLNENAHIGCDLKYFSVLSVEKNDRFGISILYVPDEWEDSAEKTLTQVHELLALNGLNSVDIACMHGNFPHQLPEVVKAQKHDPQAYLDLVKYLVFVGHVHKHSVFDRIIAQGSFDRMSHNEEEPKGHVRATLNRDGSYEVQFVENPRARIFKTIECRGLTVAETLQEIAEQIKDVPDMSFVRLSCSKSNPILQDMDQLLQHWPLIKWSKIVKEVATDQDSIVEVIATDDYVPITITKENIVKLVTQRLLDQQTSSVLVDIANKALLEMIG